ncbi:hypothetical protein GOODEAATRI_030511, partial [Goodea atripinnis]
PGLSEALHRSNCETTGGDCRTVPFQRRGRRFCDGGRVCQAGTALPRPHGGKAIGQGEESPL